MTECQPFSEPERDTRQACFHTKSCDHLQHNGVPSAMAGACLLFCDNKGSPHRLCELNTLRQVFNVCTSTVVQQAWKKGVQLAVHGVIYSPGTGLLKVIPVQSLDGFVCLPGQPNTLFMLSGVSLAHLGFLQPKMCQRYPIRPPQVLSTSTAFSGHIINLT